VTSEAQDPRRPTRAHLIALDRTSPEVREGVHAVVKEHASGWWHHFADLWIVLSDLSAQEWRGAIGAALDNQPVRALVIFLPQEEDARNWSAKGLPDGAAAWLQRNYTNTRAAADAPKSTSVESS
jgi:hypothetical protein